MSSPAPGKRSVKIHFVDICIVIRNSLDENYVKNEPKLLSVSGDDWTASMTLNEYTETTWKAYGTVGLDATEEFIRFAVVNFDETEVGHVDLPRNVVEESCSTGRSDIIKLKLKDEGRGEIPIDISLGILHDPAAGASGIELVQDWTKSWGDVSKLYDKSLNLLPDADDMKPILLHHAGETFMSCYTNSQLLNDLNSAVDAYKASVNLLTPQKLNYALTFHDYGVALTKRRQKDDLEQAFAAFERSLAVTPHGHSARPNRLNSLSVTSLDLFKRTKDVKYVDKAIESMEECVHSASPSNTELQGWLLTLGKAYLERFDVTENLSDADLSISTLRRAEQMLDENDPMKLGSLHLLGISYLHRFTISKEIRDLDEAIVSNNKVIDMVHEDDSNPNVPGTFTNLGYLWLRHFQESGKREDITKALDLLETAKKHLPFYHSLYPTLLSHIRKALSLQQNTVACPIRIKAERTIDIAALEDVIAMTRRAVSLSEGDDNCPDRAGYLHDISALLCTRFEWLGRKEDLEEAIAYASIAVDITPESNFHYSMFINNLSDLQMNKFYLTSDMSCMDEALSLARKGVEVTPADHPRFPARMLYLSSLLLTRLDYTGSSADIDEALEVAEKALEHISDDHQDYRAVLSNLGNILTQRYKLTGNLGDIDNAIYHQTRALEVLPDDAACLNNLGISFKERFNREGNPEDIYEAIAALEKAVALTPDMHPDKGRRLSTLGGILQLNYNKNEKSDPKVIERAVEVQRKALSLLGVYAETDMPGLLMNLAQALQLSFSLNHNLETVVEAIGYAKEAVKLARTRQSSELLFASLHNLAACCYTMFLASNDLTYLNYAISAQSESVNIVLNEDHPARGETFYLLGNFYHSRWKQESFGNTSNPDVGNMITAFRTAAMSPSSDSAARIRAAAMWGSISRVVDIEEGIRAYTFAISLIPRVAWLGATIEHRQLRIANISDLSMQAAVTACIADNPHLAAEWLEHGRSIVWRQLNELRTPVDELRSKNSDVADELQRLSQELEALGRRTANGYSTVEPSSSHMTKVEKQRAMKSHHELADRWDVLIKKVRSIPGFECFLKPLSFNRLATNLPDAPIVMINVSNLRSDALIIVASEELIHHVGFLQVPLHSKAAEWHRALSRCTGAQESRQSVFTRGGRPSFGPSRSSTFKLVLGEIWDWIVHPILKKLEYTPSSTPSRLWWCTTGPLAFLPLHAAGNYNDQNSPRLTTSDFVISSYTPTLSALNPSNTERLGRSNKLLALAVPDPDIPGLDLEPISSTVEEVQAVSDALLDSDIDVLRLEAEEADPERVLKELDSYDWVHLACHGSQELTNPLQSALYLQKDKLELGDIIRKSLPNAKFAFLSACQTATGVEALSEEAVHLAAGMLAAGYQSVVGTMWPISDAYAVEVARDFYSYMVEHGFEIENTASALHHAVQNLRRRLGESDDDFMLWVPYIHIGK